MTTTRREQYDVANRQDILNVRHAVRQAALSAGLSLVDQTKIVTAASELARNIIDHAGSGKVTVELLDDGLRRGVRAVFEDTGPGIPSIQDALRDGYTTGGGLGLGLGGAKRLSNEFEIESTPGVGTCIMILRWK